MREDDLEHDHDDRGDLVQSDLGTEADVDTRLELEPQSRAHHRRSVSRWPALLEDSAHE